MAFHDVIYTATDNQKLILLLNNLREQMYRYRVEYLKKEEAYPQLIAEHEELIDNISKRNKEVFSAPLGIDNPVTVQVLGICSALAVTAKLEPAIVMGLSVTVITAFANVVISLLRKTIPNRIRIIVQLVVVAALVTIVSEILKAFAYDVSVQLSVYVGLIITNCILMGRLEAFAMQNGPWESFLDGVGNGLGYAKILVIVAFFRDLLGSGTLLGFNILNYEPIQNIGYVNNGLMLMPPMALIIVACIIWYQRARHKELQEESN